MHKWRRHSKSYLLYPYITNIKLLLVSCYLPNIISWEHIWLNYHRSIVVCEWVYSEHIKTDSNNTQCVKGVINLKVWIEFASNILPSFSFLYSFGDSSNEDRRKHEQNTSEVPPFSLNCLIHTNVRIIQCTIYIYMFGSNLIYDKYG